MSATDPWRVLARRVLHDSRVRIEEHDIETSWGARFTFPMVLSNGFAKVLPVTPAGEAVFVRQYRHAPQRVTLELPAGGIEDGEDPMTAAARELAEETRLRAGRWDELGVFETSPGRSNARGFLFLALDCEPDPDAEADEPTDVVTIPLAAAIGLVGNEVTDAISVIGLLLARRHPGVARFLAPSAQDQAP